MQAFTIVSRMTGPLRPESEEPAEDEPMPSEASDALTELELDAVWRNEHAFGRDGHRAPIDFVPAKLKFDEFGQLLNPEATVQSASSRNDGNSIGSWYSSLQRSSSSAFRSVSAPAHRNVEVTPVLRPPRISKEEWFVQKVLTVEPPSASSQAASLSEMLDREPPGEFKAPVWTSIGPGNRGFALLQRSGWQEGQALGPAAASTSKLVVATKRSAEVIDLTDEGPIDLTQEDEEDGSEDDECFSKSTGDVEGDIDHVRLKTEPSCESLDNTTPLSPCEPDNTALLVPLPAFLKPDKHGIGIRLDSERRRLRLKNTAQAIAEATPEGTKKHKRILDAARKRREEVGRGARGFARMSKEEGNQRQAMMAYMNS